MSVSRYGNDGSVIKSVGDGNEMMMEAVVVVVVVVAVVVVVVTTMIIIIITFENTSLSLIPLIITSDISAEKKLLST